MRAVHSVSAVRAAEAAAMASLPSGALMQRAAAALAATCAGLLDGVYGRQVVVLTGSGDNGGDALFAGAALARRGAAVRAVLLAERAHTGGLAALRDAGGRAVAFGADAEQALGRAELVLDGILGIGGRGALRDPAAQAVGAIAPSATVVAVDVASGVDADTGVVEGAAVRADVTVTFGTWKPGLLVDPGAGHAGAVQCIDIGLQPYLATPTLTALQAVDVGALLPRADRESDKYRRGVVGVVAGSDTYTGAAVLATGGALRSGAGMVRFVSRVHPAELVRARWPEAVVSVLPASGAGVLDAGRVQAWVVGPGIGTDDAGVSLVAQVLSSDVPVVVDADGLSVLAAHRELLAARRAPTVLTPHTGELTRLLALPAEARADVEARRLEHARRAASEFGVTVLLKGSTTLVVDPAGTVRVNPTGTPLLATAGSGDVLSGVLGTLLAGGLGALDAASVAAYLHGAAARLAASADTDVAAFAADAPIIADDVLGALPRAIAGARGA